MGIHYIKSIQLQNFGSYLETNEVLIPLGLTAVVGEHDVDPLRSNGVGKSTFVNSILYALYGEGEFTLVDELVNDKNKDKKMEVILTFIDSAGKEICVRRGRQKGQSFITIYEDNQQIDAKGVAASQEYLLNVLQMDYNMFTSSVFFEQGKLDKFIDAEPSVRRSYVDKVLDLDIWRKGFKLLQSKTKKLETDKKTKEEVIGKLTIQKSELENELRLYSNVEQELENVKIKYTEIQDKVKSIESISTLITQLQDYEKRIQSSLKRISTYDTTLKSIQSQLDKLEKEKLAIVQKLNEFESTNIDTNKLKEEIEVLMLKKSDIQHKIKKCEEAFSNSLTLVSKYKAQQKSYENQLGKLKEGKCPTCFQTITQDYITQYNKPIQDKIKELAVAIESSEAEVNKSTEEKSSYVKELETIDASIFSLNNKIQEYTLQYSSLQESVARIQSSVSLLTNQLQNNQVLLQQEQQALNELNESAEKVKQEIASKENLMKERNSIYTEYQKLEKEIDILNQKIGRKQSITNMLNQIQNSLDNEYEQVNDIVHHIKLHDILTKVFQKIPSDLFSSSVSLITATSNSLIQKILPEISVNMYEDEGGKLQIDFTTDGVKRSYKRLSGGQKTVVDIGLRLGFSHVITTRTACHMGLIVLDEPFGALDTKNRTLVERVLSSLTQMFTQILVISHVGNIEVYPHVITVRMNSDNISYIN